ncbi:MAG: DNRLRE domain-containing protein [Deltaproteobacteria bacterium]|nr:DNRLRE domain-containing protein [Deltaproteobacteria bacterium]
MKVRILLMIVTILLAGVSVLANPVSPSLEEYCETLLGLKRGELERLRGGEVGVEGYAQLGINVPAYLLAGDPLVDQLVSTASRIEVLNEEISSLENVLSRLKELSKYKPYGGLTINCIADSHVYAYSYSGWNQANFGRYGALGAGWHPTGGEKRAYLRFDLSGVDPAKVSQATLRLYHYHTGGSDALTLGVYRVTSPWTEGIGTYSLKPAAQPGEIAWVNQPSFDSNPMVQFHPGMEIGKWLQIDVTPLVVEWLSGTPNYGLMIKAIGPLTGTTSHSEYGFSSREDVEGRVPVMVLASVSDLPGEFDQAWALLCAPDKEFVRSLYHCVTHREPTVQEVEAQVGLLQSGTPRKNMVQYFFASPGYVNQNHDGVRFITDACQAIYGRQPSGAELNAWPRTDRSVILAEMFNSAEHLSATADCAALWRKDMASDHPQPYFDDFSSGFVNWDISKVKLQRMDRALVWHSGNHIPVRFLRPVWMEEMVIEFDGWCEKNGLNVVWLNKNNVGYMSLLGGWFNTRSCSDVGCLGERRELVNGAHIQLGRWQHYKIVRSGDWLDAYVDGKRILHRHVPVRFEGNGYLHFMSYGSLVGVANLRICRANANVGSASNPISRKAKGSEGALALGLYPIQTPFAVASLLGQE